MTDLEFTSEDALRAIHKALGDWVKGSLSDGFECPPNADEYALELISYAKTMRDIEAILKQEGSASGHYSSLWRESPLSAGRCSS